MKLNKNQDTRIVIVGLGLMGGSYARALHARGYHVCAITKEQSSLDFAFSKGFIDEGSTTVSKEMLSKADIIVFALYPHTFVEWLKEYQHLLQPGTILTDEAVDVAFVDLHVHFAENLMFAVALLHFAQSDNCFTHLFILQMIDLCFKR